MSLRDLRDVTTLTQTLMLVIDHWDDPRALDMLKKIWTLVLDPKRMATGFMPYADPRHSALEQLGVKRFLWLNKTESAGSDGTDIYDLDRDLHAAAVAAAAYTFKLNGCRDEYKLTLDYCREYTKRVTFLSQAEYGGRSWYSDAWWFVSGKSLWHAAVARRTFHRFMILLGDGKHEAAYRWFRDGLDANTDMVETPGGVCAVNPHFTPVLMARRGQSSPVMWGFQDVTYKREDEAWEVIGNRMGDFTDAYVAASARTMMLVVLGPDDGRIAATTGGYGPAEFRGQKGLVYKGKLYPCRMVNGRVTDTEDVLQLTRGIPHVGAAWATDHPEFQQIIESHDKQPDNIKHQRFGGRLPRMFYTPRMEAK